MRIGNFDMVNFSYIFQLPYYIDGDVKLTQTVAVCILNFSLRRIDKIKLKFSKNLKWNLVKCHLDL